LQLILKSEHLVQQVLEQQLLSVAWEAKKQQVRWRWRQRRRRLRAAFSAAAAAVGGGQAKDVVVCEF